MHVYTLLERIAAAEVVVRRLQAYNDTGSLATRVVVLARKRLTQLLTEHIQGSVGDSFRVIGTGPYDEASDASK